MSFSLLTNKRNIDDFVDIKIMRNKDENNRKHNKSNKRL